MEGFSSKEARRARYCTGLTSAYFLRTGQPAAEAIRISEERDAEIRADIEAMDILEKVRAERTPKKRGRKRKDPDASQVIFV